MAGTAPLPKVCIIGAGCSGFTTAKRLKDFGAADQFLAVAAEQSGVPSVADHITSHSDVADQIQMLATVKVEMLGRASVRRPDRRLQNRPDAVKVLNTAPGRISQPFFSAARL